MALQSLFDDESIDAEIYPIAILGQVEVQNNGSVVADTAIKLAEHNSKYSVARILRVARMKTDQLSPILYELNRFYVFRFCVTYGMQRHAYDDIIS